MLGDICFTFMGENGIARFCRRRRRRRRRTLCRMTRTSARLVDSKGVFTFMFATTIFWQHSRRYRLPRPHTPYELNRSRRIHEADAHAKQSRCRRRRRRLRCLSCRFV